MNVSSPPPPHAVLHFLPVNLVFSEIIHALLISDFLSQYINKVEHPDIDLHNVAQHTVSVSEQLAKLTEGEYIFTLILLGTYFLLFYTLVRLCKGGFASLMVSQ